jgi:hypothetical protein
MRLRIAFVVTDTQFYNAVDSRWVLLVLFVTKAEIEAEQGLERFSFSMLKVADPGRVD